MVEFHGQKKIIYSDTSGTYLITGQIFNTKTKKNITQETITELNRFSKEDMKKLDELVAFTIGNKGPVVYLVTDPQCPYCKKAEEELFPMAENGEITLKVLLFPLPFHKGAKEECISIICDNKGAEGLKNRYRSENQCEAGKKKVEQTISYLKSKGISGTPTHIFADGRYKSGVMKKKAILARISSKSAKKDKK
jgi:thiol:disulfide interchange protein DsbC